jgi:signal transduction histidine kinase
VVLATLAMVVGASTTHAADSPKRVLVIHDYQRGAPAILTLEQGMLETVRGRAGMRVNVYSEFLSLTPLQPATFPVEAVAYLRAKYGPQGLDLLAVTSSRLLRFVLQHRAELFPGVPIIFGAVERHAAADIVLPDDVTGIWLSIDWAGTLAVARTLQPETTHAVIVTGASGIDRIWAASARAELASTRPPIQISHLTGLSLDTVAQRISALPPRTVVVLGAFTEDATGRGFSGPDVAQRLAPVASVPVYAMSERHIGAGAVGGHMISFDAHGRRLGQLALQVLRGERPVPGDRDTNVYTFDARQLRRWGLDARRLPRGSALLFDEPSMWKLYGAYILVGVLVIAVQGALIAALLVQRAQRRRAQGALAARLRFETLVSELSALFASQHGGDVDRHITDALRRIGEELAVDRITVGEAPTGSYRIVVTHSWTRDGVRPLPALLDGRVMPWTLSRIRERQSVAVARPEDLPVDAGTDRRTLEELGTRSLVVVPVSVSDEATAYLSISVRTERQGLDDLVARLTLLAEVFAGALAHRRAERALEQTRQHREELAHVQRVTMLGELAGALAHEINQPLAAITINAAAAARLVDAPSGQDEAGRQEMKESLTEIADDSRRASEIIHGIRALFSKEHVDRAPVDVNDVVERVVALLRTDFLRKDIRLVSRLDRTLFPVLGDPVQLQQVVLNLLVNASDAVLKGGRREITVATARRPPDRLVLLVHDAGVGIEKEQLTRIFERFVSGKPGGLGLGLSISRSIVAGHGGTIWATQNTDQGLTLHVELPT